MQGIQGATGPAGSGSGGSASFTLIKEFVTSPIETGLLFLGTPSIGTHSLFLSNTNDPLMILNNDGSFYQENRVNNYAIVNSDQFPIPLIGGTFSVTGFYKETGNLFSFMALSDNMSDDDGPVITSVIVDTTNGNLSRSSFTTASFTFEQVFANAIIKKIEADESSISLSYENTISIVENSLDINYVGVNANIISGTSAFQVLDTPTGQTRLSISENVYINGDIINNDLGSDGVFEVSQNLNDNILKVNNSIEPIVTIDGEFISSNRTIDSWLINSATYSPFPGITLSLSGSVGVYGNVFGIIGMMDIREILGGPKSFQQV